MRKLILILSLWLPIFISIGIQTKTGNWVSDFYSKKALDFFKNKNSLQEPACPSYCNKDFLLGKINYRKDTTLFVKVDKEYTWNTVYLKKEAYEAFKNMYEAAKKDNVKLVVVSGCRTFNDQQCMWENKWKSNDFTKYQNKTERALNILSYIAMPGTSRHHWGTEIDFNSAKLAYYEQGTGKKMYEWLLKNASKFGFYQPYTTIGKKRRTGYKEEKWHWSYLPLSGIFIREYAKQITPADLQGFEGAETTGNINVIDGWVEGINSSCIPFDLAAVK